jgi:adhesin transport system outer membrane protein
VNVNTHRQTLLLLFAVALCCQIAFTARALAAEQEALTLEEVATLRNVAALQSPQNQISSDARIRLLVKQAHEFSPALRELDAVIEAAEQDINVAKGARSPQITVRGSSTITGGLPSGSGSSGMPYIGANAALTVYDFGRISANVKTQEARKEAGGARYAQQANQIAIESVTVCLEYTRRRALLQAIEDYLQTVQKLVDMLTKVVDADPGRRAELVQARSRLLQAQQTRETERSGAVQIKARLNRLIGPDKSAMCDGIGASLLQLPDLEALRAAIDDQPQVQALKRDLAAASYQVDQISASRKPQVQATAAHAPILPGINNDYYQSIGITASMPLYDGNILRSSEQAALERVRAISERIDLIKLQLDTDYRERFQMATDSLRRVDEFASLIEVNDRVRKDFFVQWYSLGRRSLFELLAIEQEQYNLQRGYFTSLFDAMINITNMLGNAGYLAAIEPRVKASKQ